MKRKYLSESHLKYSEACQKEVTEMMKHPLSADEQEAQMLRNKCGSHYSYECQSKVKMERQVRKMRESLKREIDPLSKGLHPFPTLTIRRTFEVINIARARDKDYDDTLLDEVDDIDSEEALKEWLPWSGHSLDLEYAEIRLEPDWYSLPSGESGWIFTMYGNSNDPVDYARYAIRLQEAGIPFFIRKDIKNLLKCLGYILRSKRREYKEMGIES